MKGIVDEKQEKQRLDPKCWTGKHKEGTKIKGGVRVNNCVPNESIDEAGSPAQQAAIAINMKKHHKKPKHVDEAKAKQYVKPYNDPQTGKQIGWKSSDGYHVKYWQMFAKDSAIKHAKLNPAEVDEGEVVPFTRKKAEHDKYADAFSKQHGEEHRYGVGWIECDYCGDVACDYDCDESQADGFNEDYTGMYAAEKTPKINPYAGVKDRQFRGAISEISDTKTSVNQTGGFITPEHDDAYQKLKRVAPRVFDYIRYEAPVPLDPILTLKAFHQMQRNEESVLRMMKQGLAQDTKAMYGADHPALAESVRRFWNKMLNETPTDNPTGASGEGGRRTYRAKPAGEIEEDTAYAGGMGQGHGGQSYRKFKPKMAGVIKKESSIMKGLRKEGR